MIRLGFAVLFLLIALSAGGASASGGLGDVVITSQYSATAHLGAGRQSTSFRLHEPAGVILLYRLTAPKGVSVRAFTRLPGVTVLRIASRPTGPSASCTSAGQRIICTVGEEWCPIPEGTWRFRVTKLAGPAGEVSLRFVVGEPPR